MTRGITFAQSDGSPLDEVPAVDGSGDEGFLPMLSTGLGELSAAPVLGESVLGFNPLDEDTRTALPSGQLDKAVLAYQQTLAPQRIVIPAISLDESISDAWLREVEYRGESYEQWVAPAYGAGWHPTSAPLGRIGNTVLNGHHNAWGEVFRNLAEIEQGDEITIYSDGQAFTYHVGLVLILPEKYQSLETRLDNARWISASEDERLTLVTCWPYETNTHRVIVVATPVEN